MNTINEKLSDSALPKAYALYFIAEVDWRKTNINRNLITIGSKYIEDYKKVAGSL